MKIQSFLKTWLKDTHDITLSDQDLGKGSFSLVFQGEHFKEGSIAIKLTEKGSLPEDLVDNESLVYQKINRLIHKGKIPKKYKIFLKIEEQNISDEENYKFSPALKFAIASLCA